MGTVIYNSSKLIPAPLVNIQKQYSRSADGHKVGSKFTITLTGRLVSHRGSPSTTAFWTVSGYPPDESDNGLANILKKQELVRHLFSEDGKSLEVQCEGANPPMKCYPHIIDISFAEGPWVQYCDYTITLETSEVFGSFNGEDFVDDQDFFRDDANENLYIDSAAEDWSLEMQENAESPGLEYTYMLRHNINAIGKRVYDDNGLVSEGWEQARRWVNPRMGIDTDYLHSTSGLYLPTHYQALNYVKTENTDELGGSYTIGETWLVASGNVMETLSLSINDGGTSSTNTSVSVDGGIQGLDSKNNNLVVTQTKYEAALAKWVSLTAGSPNHIIFQRAELYAGINLNNQPVVNTHSKNVTAGNISYNFTYDDRPTNYIEDAISETISIADTKPADVVGRVVVLGRAQGPVLQDMGTRTEYKRSLSISALMPAYSGVAPVNSANVQTMLDAGPNAKIQVLVDGMDDNLRGVYNQVFVDGDSSTWNPKTGEYSRNVSWLYQDCILSAASDPPVTGSV